LSYARRQVPWRHRITIVRHGRYSKYLPGRYVNRYSEATQDKKLLSLRDDIALIEACLADLLLQLHTGENGQLWQETIEAKQRLDHALSRSDTEAVRDAMADLKDSLENGGEDQANWGKIVDLLERKRRLSDSEHRRQVQNGELVTVEEMLAFGDALAVAVQRQVDDQDTLDAIHRDLFVHFRDMLEMGYLTRSIDMSDAEDGS
jgi:hypothetical protein